MTTSSPKPEQPQKKGGELFHIFKSATPEKRIEFMNKLITELDVVLLKSQLKCIKENPGNNLPEWGISRLIDNDSKETFTFKIRGGSDKHNLNVYFDLALFSTPLKHLGPNPFTAERYLQRSVEPELVVKPGAPQTLSFDLSKESKDIDKLQRYFDHLQDILITRPKRYLTGGDAPFRDEMQNVAMVKEARDVIAQKQRALNEQAPKPGQQVPQEDPKNSTRFKP